MSHDPMRYSVLVAYGPDDTGLLRDLSHLAKEHKVDIVESIAHMLGTEAMLFMHVLGEPDQLDLLLDEARSAQPKLTIDMRDAKEPTTDPARDVLPYRIQAIAIDEPGVLADMAEFLADEENTLFDEDKKIWIVSYHDEPYVAPRSAHQCRIMTFTVHFPIKANRSNFEAALQGHVAADEHLLSASCTPM